ncbi:MAG: GalE [Bacilli bacterium]|nr:GalE [Bacilli bacterium]
MTILVTGGAGYIGSHTCVALLEAGYEIAILDSFQNSKPELLKRIKEITGKDFKAYDVDLLDSDGVERVFSECSIDAVIHFAGLKAVGESVANPLHYYHNNIVGTLVLCQTMQKYGVNRLVFSSSATVYGVQETVPLTEDLPLCPASPYGRTKMMIEQILTDICSSDSNWSVALLRYFNPVGAHPSGLIGEDPTGVPNNLLPFVTQVAVGKLNQLSVYGNDYETPDGTGIRDYIHIMDLANGHLKALNWVTLNTGADAFNLGSGTGHSVMQVIKTFEEATGVKISYQAAARRPGDIAISYADPTKAKRLLGWQTERSLLEMCVDAWRWQRNNPNGYQSES